MLNVKGCLQPYFKHFVFLISTCTDLNSSAQIMFHIITYNYVFVCVFFFCYKYFYYSEKGGKWSVGRSAFSLVMFTYCSIFVFLCRFITSTGRIGICSFFRLCFFVSYRAKLIDWINKLVCGTFVIV